MALATWLVKVLAQAANRVTPKQSILTDIRIASVVERTSRQNTKGNRQWNPKP
jgi:hypothetical protein